MQSVPCRVAGWPGSFRIRCLESGSDTCLELPRALRELPISAQRSVSRVQQPIARQLDPVWLQPRALFAHPGFSLPRPSPLQERRRACRLQRPARGRRHRLLPQEAGACPWFTCHLRWANAPGVGWARAPLWSCRRRTDPAHSALASPRARQYVAPHPSVSAEIRKRAAVPRSDHL